MSYEVFGENPGADLCDKCGEPMTDPFERHRCPEPEEGGFRAAAADAFCAEYGHDYGALGICNHCGETERRTWIVPEFNVSEGEE